MIGRKTLLAVCILLAGCSGAPVEQEVEATNILPLEVVGMHFTGPDTVKSGWTTVRVDNAAGMEHFALVYRLPDGVTAEMVDEDLVRVFQASLTERLAGNDAEADRLLGTMPDWVAQLIWLGGPGMMSDGTAAEATMYLEPGNYIAECYVKTNGVQHNFNPEPGQLGMVHPFTVVDEAGGMAEPDANVTLELRNDGYRIADGAFRPGANRVRANFVEQKLYNGFVGHDAHVFRIDRDADVDAAAKWIDFFPATGQQTPAPARFVGGIHDMPQGSTGYFTLDLEPGRYGIVAEIPDTQGTGHFAEFEVKE